MQLSPYLIGLVVLIVLYLLYRIFTGKWDITLIYEGADGRASSSKLQWFLWTVVFIFAYVTVYAARGVPDPITEVPANVLIAMGFSVTTMAASKGITASYVASGRVLKTSVPAGSGGLSAIFLDDDGYPDLSKIQMLAWTFIAIGVYLVNLIWIVNKPPVNSLPNIDGSLMVLMGLGQGAYLGKKLTTSDQARLTGLSVSSGPAGTRVGITGLSFGAQQSGSFIMIDGNPFPAAIVSTDWADSLVTFSIPPTQPSGAAWPATGQKIMLGLMIGGIESANQLPFTVV